MTRSSKGAGAWLRRADASPYFLLTLTMLFWAGNAVAGRWIVPEIPPVALNFWRWVIALVVVLPFAWPHLGRGWSLIVARWKIMTLLAVLSVTLFNTLYYLALTRTAALNVALVGSVTPVVIPLLAWIVHGARLARKQAVGLAAAALGVLVVICRGDLATLGALDFNAGDLIALASVLAWSIYSVLLRHQPAGLHPLAFATAMFAIGTLCALPLYALEMGIGRAATWSIEGIAILLYIGLFPSSLAFIFWNRAVAAVGPATAGLFIYLIPPLVAGLAFLLLGEPIHPYHLGGIALVFAGIHWATRGNRRASTAD